MKRTAFTLVELSIVLVIIGLLIGGVIAGQSLVEASRVTAQVTQLSEINAAVRNFQTRFGELPGDIGNTAAYSGLLSDIPAGTAYGNGDGNGTLTQSGSENAFTNATGEITMFFRHLSEAGLLKSNYDGAQTGATLGSSFPEAKLGLGGLGVYGSNRNNYLQLGQQNASTTTAVYANGLTPQQARQLDVKLDDGEPVTGNILAHGGATPYAAATLTAGVTPGCLTAAGTAYDVISSESVLCQISVLMR